MVIQEMQRIKQDRIGKLPLRWYDQANVNNPFSGLSIAGLIQQHRYLPDLTAILGICEDQLPVLLDWTNPSPGSLLIGADHLGGVGQLLRLALITTLSRSSQQDVEILVVSREPENWESFPRFPGQPAIEILPIFDRSSGTAILRYSRLLDQRMNGRSGRAVHLLFVDDISYINHADFEVQTNFQWLAKEGPRYQMWTLAGIESSLIEKNDRLLPSFRTRIIGRMSDPFHAGWLANARPPDTAMFHPFHQFCTRINQTWMNFWLPGQA